jgi:DNA-binding beta-propeller fold protein YncE
VAKLYLASSTTESVSEFVDALAYSPDGKTLYAGMFQAETGVRVIDATKWELLADIRFEPNERNQYFKHTNPLGLAFSHGLLYVANRENQEVVVVDPGTRKPLARLQFPDGKHEFHRVLTEGDRVYLADQEAAYELDGWTLSRRLSRPAEKERPPVELVLKVRAE